jgi:hypothetical protein
MASPGAVANLATPRVGSGPLTPNAAASVERRYVSRRPRFGRREREKPPAGLKRERIALG